MKTKKIDPLRTSGLLLPVAVAGMLAGFGAGCTAKESEKPAAPAVKATEKTADAVAMAKHACKGMNSCKGQGGCSTGDAGCSGKNSCKGKGGCATAEKHSCKGANACKGQGGCTSGDNACAGKNSCKGKGGCAVPVEHK